MTRRRWAGRCYQAALHALWGAADAGLDPVLVHGRPVGHRDDPAEQRLDHAWIEVGHAVTDLTMGAHLVPRARYYELWKLSAEHVRRYTPREAAGLLLALNSCGPWHEVAPAT